MTYLSLSTTKGNCKFLLYFPTVTIMAVAGLQKETSVTLLMREQQNIKTEKHFQYSHGLM